MSPMQTVTFTVPNHTKAQIQRWLHQTARINNIPLIELSIVSAASLEQVKQNETLEAVRDSLIAPVHERMSRLELRVAALERGEGNESDDDDLG